MLTTAELRKWVDRFRVPEAQIRRDHLISHTIAALAATKLEVVFFGGTALCRTHLRDWPLSEDIDLLVDDINGIAGDLESELPQRLRREHPRAVTSLRPHEAGRVGELRSGDVTIRLQLVRKDASYRRYPISSTAVDLRYEDLPSSVDLATPTPAGAAAMKLNAWAERATPRDLCDLYGLALGGLLTGEAIQLASAAGTTPAAWMYADERIPSKAAWHAALGHQMAEPPDPAEALHAVREAVFGRRV